MSRDTCQVIPGACVGHARSAPRAVMPQLDPRALRRWVRKGKVPDYLIRLANGRSLSTQERRIVKEISHVLPKRLTQPVKITLEKLPLAKLSVTQREARHSTVKALEKRVADGEDITRDDPIVVSYALGGGFKVIDGHHRFLAHKLHSLQTRSKPQTLHAYLLHLPHAEAMKLAWSLSVDTHAF